MSTNKQTCGNELEWLAFCYAAGELSADEAEQFDARLATDQGAREALARTVELTQTIAAAESQSGQIASAAQVSLALQAKKTRNARLAWVAVASAAAVLLAIFNIYAPPHTSRSDNNQQLAFAWTAARAQMAIATDAGVWPALEVGSLESVNDVGDPMSGDFAQVDVAAAPSWLTAAILGQMSAAPGPDALNDGPLEN